MIGGKPAILEIAKAMAEHAAVRQATVTQNLAHANTPGYKAKDVQAFEAAVASGAPARIEADRTAPAKPNGNSVHLEDQVIKMTEAKTQHDIALGLWDKTLTMYAEALGRRR